MQTHDLGNLFVHIIKLRPQTSLVHRANTHELEFPYRISRSWVFRIWGKRGFVLGYWRKQQINEQDALLTALGGHDFLVLDDTGHIRDCFEVPFTGHQV